jgi:hypothetical protein
MWKFFRRAARPAKGPPTPRGGARPPSRPARLQVEALEGRLSPGGLFGSALDLSLEEAALFWQGPEGLAASQGTPQPGPDASTAARASTGASKTDPDPQAGGDPLPIPGGFANPTGGPFIHFNRPGPADSAAPNGNDPSTIADFNGDIGSMRVTGTGTDGAGNTLYFQADMRFMQGLYQDVNGTLHQGTFAFV